MATAEKILLVDGHSAIFALPQFCELHHGATRYLARLELVKWLQRFADVTDWNTVVVFDGKQTERGMEGGKADGVLTIYSRNGETADSVIERLAARFGEKDEVLVASNDAMVRTTCAVFQARTCSVEALRIMVDGR